MANKASPKFLYKVFSKLIELGLLHFSKKLAGEPEGFAGEISPAKRWLCRPVLCSIDIGLTFTHFQKLKYCSSYGFPKSDMLLQFHGKNLSRGLKTTVLELIGCFVF